MPRRFPRPRRARKSPQLRRRRQGSFKRFRTHLVRRLPSKRTRRRIKKNLGKRASRGWQRTPPVLRWLLATAAAVALFFVSNGLYQVFRKPTELFFPVGHALHKSPSQTWSAYASLFRAHATDVITADFLAALAQIEASGNPVARTYWRWSFSRDLFSIYRPASSAVGLFQLTDGTFDEARRFCIHDHVVVSDGAWNDFDSCWFNALYTRVIPSHAIELTSAYLDHHVRQISRRHSRGHRSLAAHQELAAMIHLCGAGAANGYARRGMVLTPGQHCGTHDVRRYLDKVAAQRVRFRKLASAD